MKKIFILSLVITLFLGNFSLANASAYAFVVQRSGSDSILISDGYSQYIIEHNYDCYDSDFYEGETIYIDSSYPGYGDTIIIPGYSNKTCEVTNSSSVNIKQFYVDKVMDSDDKIIVTDKNGTQILVEYGIGCGVSMWRYEGKKVDIDIGGSFLDGIGDRMYLFESGRDCKIWDGDEISSNRSTYTTSASYPTSVSQSSCPINSHQSTDDPSMCSCNTGYQVNSTKTACVLATKTAPLVCPLGNTCTPDPNMPQIGNCPAGYRCTPVAQTKSTSITFSRNLKVGDSGEDVTQLQAFLQEQGFLIMPVGARSGYFGNLTKEAVKKLQRKNNISATGEFGLNMNQLLN